jgi:drug/metabolite transporter (DMT)-like permease
MQQLIFHKFSEDYHGIFYMILCCFFISLMVAIVKHLSKEFHIFFILMLRNFFSLLFFIPSIFRNYKTLLTTKKIHLHCFRSANGMLSMLCWFYAITLLPLSEAVSISFIVPFTTTLAAMLFLKEKVRKRNWMASFFGLIGVVIILRPGFKELATGHYFVFAAVFLWTISNLLLKIMSKTEKPKTIVAYMSFIMLIISIPFALPFLKPINGYVNLFWFLALGLISNLSYFSLSFAYTKSDISLLQPFDFTRLVFISVIAYFAFGEVIDYWIICGSFVILCGVLIMLPKRKRDKLYQFPSKNKQYDKIFLR